MERNEDTYKDDSSSDTVIPHSSSEEEKPPGNISGEYIAVCDSSSSLDTLVSDSGGVAILSSSVNTDDRKKSKFDTLKSSFRESSIFKIKKKSCANVTNTSCVQVDLEHHEKETLPQQSQQYKYEKKQPSASDVASATTLKTKKKKSHSLVRKLSLNKFRLPLEQETRHTLKDGDNSRSQNQSLQDSPVRLRTLIKLAKRGQEDDTIENQRVKEKLKEIEKPVKNIVVVQHESPSSLITQQDTQQQQQLQQEEQDNISCSDTQCVSTIPYVLSKYPEHSETKLAENRKNISKKGFDSDSSVASKLSPIHRKLTLLEEKGAIFHQGLFDSSKDDKVIAVEENKSNIINDPFKRWEEERKKKIRQINVKTSETFSSFGNSSGENTGSDYLDDIERDYTESYDRKDSNYSNFHAAMAPIMGAIEYLAKSSSNNAPNIGVGEKREHLYKILVIGELGAGKTSIIKRYVHQFFSQHYRATIGVDFALKVLNWDPHTIIRLQLWDIAGQERFGNMTRVYYKEAVGAFIVFDVTRSATLDAVVKWKQDLDSKVQLPDGSPIPCVLLANKCDQQKEGLVNSPTKMDEYCKEKNFSGWFETSAKENINIEEAARFLVNKILQNDQIMKGTNSQDQMDGERFTLHQSSTNSKKFCAC